MSEDRELQRLRDAVWNDGEPRLGVDERYCFWCQQRIEDPGGYLIDGKHLVDCPWILEKDRRDLVEIRVGDTVCDGYGDTRWVVLAIDGERAWIKNVNGTGHVTTSTKSLRKAS